jgi:hypothetical protein
MGQIHQDASHVSLTISSSHLNRVDAGIVMKRAEDAMVLDLIDVRLAKMATIF